MASVNKTSLRTEFEAIKTRFAALCADGKLSPEGRALFEAMLLLFELLLAVFMEKATPKGTHNSGLPSSQTEPDETARRQTGAKGKGPDRRAARGESTRVVVETRTATVTECRACGCDLKDIHPSGHERRVKVDIVFETTELTVQADIKTCPRCGAETRGQFPDNLPGPLQYGHGIVAFATHLLTAQMRSLQRAAQTLKALTGRVVAEATLLAWLSRLHEALVKYETEVLRFARDPDVPFTNNRAERALRMAKVKQKVAGCFRTPKYAAAYCRISSYLQSMAQQGYNPLTAIEIALNGNAASMVEKPPQNNPDDQDQDKGGE